MRIQRRFATIPTVSSNKAWQHLFLRLKFTYLSKTSRAVFVTCDEKHSHRVWVCKRNKWPGGVPGVGKLLGTWQIIDDPSLRFRLGISVWKKVIAVKSVKIDIHRRNAVLGSLRRRLFTIFLSFVNNTYLPSRLQWNLYSNPYISHLTEKKKYCTLQIGS